MSGCTAHHPADASTARTVWQHDGAPELGHNVVTPKNALKNGTLGKLLFNPKWWPSANALVEFWCIVLEKPKGTQDAPSTNVSSAKPERSKPAANTARKLHPEYKTISSKEFSRKHSRLT